MNKRIILIAFMLNMVAIANVSAQFPQADISNGVIHAKLYLPDVQNGYYRAMRFDWAGVVSSLQYKGHEFFGQWFEKHNPLTHDAIMGPVEGILPLGFDEAKAGESFIMIGVGTVKKPDDKIYSFSRNYEILNNGKWNVKKKKDRIEFTHELKDQNGYAYIYKKTLRLAKGKPVLLLEHSLKNTGLKKIETSVFNHNFFMIDNETTGPNMSVKFPFELKTDNSPVGRDIAVYKEKELTFNRPLKKGESVFTHLTGFSSDVKDYDIKIDNNKTGSGVRITADHPISSLVFWSIATTLCPEPYINITALPGKEFKWTINYEFHTAN